MNTVAEYEDTRFTMGGALRFFFRSVQPCSGTDEKRVVVFVRLRLALIAEGRIVSMYP